MLSFKSENIQIVVFCICYCAASKFLLSLFFLGPRSTETCHSDTQENAGAGRGRTSGTHTHKQTNKCAVPKLDLHASSHSSAARLRSPAAAKKTEEGPITSHIIIACIVASNLTSCCLVQTVWWVTATLFSLNLLLITRPDQFTGLDGGAAEEPVTVAGGADWKCQEESSPSQGQDSARPGEETWLFY